MIGPVIFPRNRFSQRRPGSSFRPPLKVETGRTELGAPIGLSGTERTSGNTIARVTGPKRAASCKTHTLAPATWAVTPRPQRPRFHGSRPR